MRFEEAYEGWKLGRLTQGEAATLLGMSERNFRRHNNSIYSGIAIQGV
jgi:hypothetical protein